MPMHFLVFNGIKQTNDKVYNFVHKRTAPFYNDPGPWYYPTAEDLFNIIAIILLIHIFTVQTKKEPLSK